MLRTGCGIRVLTVVVASVLIVGCNQGQEPSSTVAEDNPSWTEKQAIEQLYDYLVKAASFSEVETTIVRIKLGGELSAAWMAWLDRQNDYEKESWETVYTEIGGIVPIACSKGALRELVVYQGNGSWLIKIIGEWELDEQTGEVTALNEKAQELMEWITPRTYSNSQYGYSINYPPSWNLDDSDESLVMLWSPNAKASAEITIRDTYPNYEFSDESAIEDWVEATVKVYRQKDAYFELIRNEQEEAGQLPEWHLEYYYAKQTGEPLLWARHRLLFTRWRQYDVAVQVSKEDRNNYTAELSSILDSFKLNH